MKKNLEANLEENLTVRLFGSLTVEIGGSPLPSLHARKGDLLLALLLLRAGQEVSRETLAATLWPDSLRPNGLAVLRQSLANLRRMLGSESSRLQSPTAHTLRFDITGAIIDVLEFDRLVRRNDRDSLQRALALYRGPLLEECEEAWVLAEREAREKAYLSALETLAAQALADGAAEEAIELLRRGVQTAPWHEPLHRSLMRALANQGHFADGLQVYTALRNRLFEAYRMAPQPGTTALFQQLREAARKPLAPASSSSYSNSSVAEGAAGNVPMPLTALIGRTEESRTVLAHLRVARLVSIVGTGGVGKTRLALHVANELKEMYRDGVWFIDLSALTTPQALIPFIATTLGLREPQGHDERSPLATALSARQMLLLLDNCDHLVPSCAELARELLNHCPGLRLLITSRQPLGLTGEIVTRLEGLALPVPGEEATYGKIAPSVRLFVERAQAVHSTFLLTEDSLTEDSLTEDSLTEDNLIAESSETTASVAEICHLLDGLPLAIELAAALVEAFTVQEIAARLGASFGLLTSNDPTRPARHQTLEAVVEWSYALLTSEEQRLLCRLSVFAGGWTLEAAESVCADATLEAWKIVRLLTRLVTKSLVMPQPHGTSMRYRLLQTIRHSILQRLEPSGETAETRRRHFLYYLHFAEEAQHALTGGEQAAWLERLDTEQANFRTALQDSGVLGYETLRLCCALGRFWQIRGYFGEGYEQITQALAQAEATCPPASRADALGWASLFATYQGNLQGYELAQQALDLWSSVGDMRGRASASGCMGIAAMHRGSLDEARSIFAQSLKAAEEAGDRSGIASACGYLGLVNASVGEAGADDYFQRSLALRQESGDLWGIAASLNNLGLLAKQREEWPRARTLLEESLALRRRLKDRRSLAITLNLLGTVLCQQDELEQARRLLGEGLHLCWQRNDLRNIAYALEAFSCLRERQQEYRQAAQLQGAAAHLRSKTNSPLSPIDQEASNKVRIRLELHLGTVEYQRQWTEGAAMTLELAVGICLHLIAATQ